MAEPLSNGAAYDSVPESYVFPVDKRPGNSASSAAAIPVVDLAGDDQDKIVKQIIDAGKEFGFFQVINHGVADEVMSEMMSSAEEFFRLPTEEKMVHYSTDFKKVPRFYTSIGNEQEKGALYWRDCLKLGCYPFEQFKDQWPEKPWQLRAALEAYTTAVRAVAGRLLRLTAVGLGLEEGHFDGELSGGPVLMNVNHYVACPDPSLTLGLAPHCDPNLVTVLMETGAGGLQVLRHGGGWVDVEPLPGALVVNLGHQMEVISNGCLMSAEHRVVTNARATRTTLATFIMPETGCTVAPVVTGGSCGEAPLYRPYTYQEFMGVYLAAGGERDAVLARFQINQ
ncbi:hypothetical protein EJB05_46798, partial [Eragrostis curvula]